MIGLLASVIFFSVGVTLGQTGNDKQDAKLISVPKPTLPNEAMKSGDGGKVSVRVAVNKNGNVTAADDVTGPDWVCPAVNTPGILALRDVAKKSAMKAKFSPATQNGKPVEAIMRLNFSFSNPKPKPGLTITPARVAIDKSNDKSPPTTLGSSMPASDNDIKTVSGGVLNGKATKLAKPEYPAAARAVHAGGSVNIQLLIETDGSVFSAEPVSGHPFLQFASRRAACDSRFTPTLLSGRPVKVSGVITYNFVP